jgi:hypothetical protein
MDEIVGLVIGATLTLLIFSYLLGDNVLYRWALALLVGSSAGYAMGVAIQFVLREWITPALGGTDLTLSYVYAVPLVLGCLLLLKGFPPTKFLGKIAVIGNIPLGYLVGVGAGVATAGALTGTLLPQVLATGGDISLNSDVFGLVRAVTVAVGTILALLSFARRPQAAEGPEEAQGTWRRLWLKRAGRVFIVAALGAAFAGALTSALTALVMRLWQLAELLNRLIVMIG